MKLMKTTKKFFKKGIGSISTLGLFAFVMLSNSAFATNSALVWEEPTQLVQESISGPMAKAISIVVIVVSAFGWAFTDGGTFLGKGVKIVCALAIIAGAGKLLTGLFGNFATGLIFI